MAQAPLSRQDVDRGAFLSLLSTLYHKNLDIRFTGLGAAFLARLTALTRRFYAIQLLLWRRHGVYHGAVEFVIGISAALSLVLLFVLSAGGPPPVGKFLVFACYTVLIFPNLSQIGEAWPMINDARAALGRIEGTTAGAGQLHHVHATPARFGNIVFDEVSLRNAYGDVIIDRASFVIRPGEKVSLFGESGTGKTSLLTLLLGLQPPTSGRITIGGRDVGTLALADIKRFFVFARAQPAFLPGRVDENIVLHRQLDDAELRNVLGRARLAARLAGERDGVHAAIRDKGEPFSGGEQQRIAFACVLLSDAPCLILDEALNSLDEDSELWMLWRLIAESRDRTVICVSHRRNAARLFPYRIEIAKGGKVTVVRSPGE